MRTFSLLLLPLYWAQYAVSQVPQKDILSIMLNHMHAVNVEAREKHFAGCPYSLVDYNVSIPPSLLTSQFAHEITSIHHLTRLLNGFLRHRNRDVLSAQLDAVEPVARSAAMVLLDAERRLSGTHLCWFNGQPITTGQDVRMTALDGDNTICRYFFYGKSAALINSNQDAVREEQRTRPVPATGWQFIRDNEKNVLPLLRPVWSNLMQPNRSLDERTAWTAPYYSCNGTWLITYLIALSGGRPGDLNSEGGDHIIRGVFAVDIPLEQHVDVNQCADDQHPGSPFAYTNKCHRDSTMCHNISGEGFRRGSYTCNCLPGYYLEGDPNKLFSGSDIETAYERKLVSQSDEYDAKFKCLPCAPECEDCMDGSACVVTYDIVARGLPLGALAFCITCSLFVGGAVYRYRKRKVIASATWPLLENIVFGAIMIYSSVIIRYFHPSFHLCIVEPWLRELGFVFFYCGVILKLYKVVTEFRTRKAHCVYVRDKDLVKYHVGIILITLGFMAAWTSVTMDLRRSGMALVLTEQAEDTMKYQICRMSLWDFVAEGLEILILLWGIYLSYLARNCKTLYMERRLLTAAIIVELLVSGCLYLIRHVIGYKVHPDVIYLLYFSRSQLTVTVNMCIIFGGKMWYIFRPQDDPFRKNQQHGLAGRAAELEKLNDGIFAGDLELNQIPLADMDHGEIRMELRRLYAQMQVLKTKAMRKDNPHISKKKGGRKMHAPHRRHPKYDEETTAAKTPEESSASQENCHQDIPTVYEDEATCTFSSPLHTAFAGIAQNSAASRKAGLNIAMNYGHVTNL